MSSRTKVLKEVTCIRCHKKIKKGGFAIRVQSGFSSFPFYYHPSCHEKEYAVDYNKHTKSIQSVSRGVNIKQDTVKVEAK